MAPGSSRSSRSSIRLSQPMPMIIEDVADTPRPHVPPKSPNRRSVGPPPVRSNSSRSSLRSQTGTPLATIPGRGGGGGAKSDGPEVLQKEGGSPPHAQPNVHGTPFKLRKGWYRTILTILLLAGLIIGLSVGLTIGLRKRKSSSSSSSNSATQDTLFPAGSFSFTTALSNVSTSCSPSSWKCYPYALLSPATYHWTIRSSSSSSSAYVISSSPNPFAPSFQNATMTLLDGNQYTERFTFTLSLPKTVSTQIETTSSSPPPPPQGGKGSNNKIIATCRFNTTILSATIWTRVRASYPANITSVQVPINNNGTGGSSNGGGGAALLWTPWPFAVEVWERAEPGDEGECKDSSGNVVVPVVGGGGSRNDNDDDDDANRAGEPKPPIQEKGECACGYRNFDLETIASQEGNGTAATTTTTTTSRRKREEGYKYI